MKFLRFLGLGALCAAIPARAIYAPVPESDMGKAVSVDVLAGVSHDSNIFGAPTGEISSAIFTFSPKISVNGSLTDQAFASGSYKLTVDHFENRPGDKTIESHEFMARFAYSFNKATTLDISDMYQIQKNPESLLPGIPLPVNSEQSFKRNELNGTFSTMLNPKVGLTAKARLVHYKYDAARLGASLDRAENLLGLSTEFGVLPTVKVVGEVRYQDIQYKQGGATKDKESLFGLVGINYQVAEEISASGRVGVEKRERAGDVDETVPYTEITGRYDYGEGSYFGVGFFYTLEEASDVATYTDTRVNRFFVNVQHAITAQLVASGSLAYEPSRLQGRVGVPDIDETTVRVGVALSYVPSRNWTFTGSYDHDDVASHDPGRDSLRDRYGVTARLSF